MFKFYLKVRKYIFTNYVNPRESYIKPIKFDDWVTVVSKFLDNGSIPIIGNRIRDELNNNSTEKVFKNTYDYVAFTKDQYITNRVIDILL